MLMASEYKMLCYENSGTPKIPLMTKVFAPYENNGAAYRISCNE